MLVIYSKIKSPENKHKLNKSNNKQHKQQTTTTCNYHAMATGNGSKAYDDQVAGNVVLSLMIKH